MHLTERQEEIVSRMRQGMTVKEVARDLDLAVSTITGHLDRMYRRANLERGSIRLLLVKLEKENGR